MGEKRNAYRILVEKPEGENSWEDQDVGGCMILKWILERMGWDWLRIWTNGGLL
jgi:hypothetical protein